MKLNGNHQNNRSEPERKQPREPGREKRRTPGKAGKTAAIAVCVVLVLAFAAVELRSRKC